MAHDRPAPVAPSAWRALGRRWRAVGEAMGRVITPVLMTVFFVLAVTPLALLLRLLRIRPLGPGATGRERGWIRRAPVTDVAAHFLRPF